MTNDHIKQFSIQVALCKDVFTKHPRRDKKLYSVPGRGHMEEICSAAILATNCSAGVTPELNLRERVTRMSQKSPNKPLKNGGDITKISKQGYQWPHKSLTSSKNLNKINCILCIIPPY